MTDFLDSTPSMFGGGLPNYTPQTPDPFATVQQPTATMGPLAANAQPAAWYDSLIQNLGITGPQKNDIFGMKPDAFSRVFGQLASAIAPGSIGDRMGQIATAMGQAKLLGEAAKKQEKASQAFLQKVLATQGHKDVASLIADPNFDTNSLVNNPLLSLLSHKGEEGIMNSTPKDLGLSGLSLLGDVPKLNNGGA